jgi:ABC-2 type transport system ATP-binding protein
MVNSEPTSPTYIAPAHAIEIKDLRKVYKGSKKGGPKEALKGINLTIPRGSIFGLLGPNGAGKSTLINILAGLVLKTSGTAKIWNYDVTEDPRRAKAAIGIVPQELNLDAFFTPRELLELHAGLYGVPKKERITDALLAAVDLTDKADAYARTLSGGMRRRLMVAKAMVHQPPVLVLDEPTAGVDVELRRALWDYVRRLNKAGTTVLLTTHYLEEAEELCDTIAIINKGELVANDRKENLLKGVDSKEIRITLAEPLVAPPPALATMGFQMKKDGRVLSLRYPPSRTDVGAILAAVHAANLNIVDISTREADLEDIFLQLVRG